MNACLSASTRSSVFARAPLPPSLLFFIFSAEAPAAGDDDDGGGASSSSAASKRGAVERTPHPHVAPELTELRRRRAIKLAALQQLAETERRLHGAEATEKRFDFFMKGAELFTNFLPLQTIQH